MNFAWKSGWPLVVAAGCALLLGACGFVGTDGSGSGASGPGASPQAAPARGDGSILIAWTIDGAPPSAERCAGVDHLDFVLDYDTGEEIAIGPIPCALDRFRYDDLAEGAGTLYLTARDASDCDLADGQARIEVGATRPDAPTPTVALPSPQGCR